MKSFFLTAQAAAAEADEQTRFCSGAVQYRSGVIVIDGSLMASASVLSGFPGIGHLLTWERFRGRFFQGNFSGDAPKSRGKGEVVDSWRSEIEA